MSYHDVAGHNIQMEIDSEVVRRRRSSSTGVDLWSVFRPILPAAA